MHSSASRAPFLSEHLSDPIWMQTSTVQDPMWAKGEEIYIGTTDCKNYFFLEVSM